MKKVNFATQLNRQPTLVSESGEPIYKWDYISEETGELRTEEQNVYEKIQSFRRQTDYKLRIAAGEEVNDVKGQYMDISQLGNNPSAINDYISNLVARVQQDILGQGLGKEATQDSAAVPTLGTQGQENPMQNQENQQQGGESK